MHPAGCCRCWPSSTPPRGLDVKPHSCNGGRLSAGFGKSKGGAIDYEGIRSGRRGVSSVGVVVGKV
jgi:hypothetical protein